MAETPAIDNLAIKLFADGADLDGIVEMYADPRIKGFTTNPTLMRKAGIADYESFGRQVLAAVPDRPVSLEVFADEFDEIEAQARVIASWGNNVNVKIPVTNTRGEFSGPVIKRLSDSGICINVTAIMTAAQVEKIAACLSAEVPAIVSVFAGRIADTGMDPIPMMTECVQILESKPQAELLWASPRELLNIFQADACGCHIITATTDILKKLASAGKDLNVFSLETVKMFYDDAASAGYSIDT